MELKKTILEGFPLVHDIALDMPTVAELLSVPVYDRCSAEDFYRHGGEIARYFLDKAPIKNDMKYVNIWTSLQLLKPGVGTIKYKHNWHVDGSKVPFNAYDRLFLVVSDCTATTEFNKDRIELFVDSEITHQEYDKYINDNADEIGIVGKRIPANQFVEFTAGHAHRATNPEKEEFRFMFRICESDELPSQHISKSRLLGSYIYSEVGKPTKNIINSEEDRFFIHL
ncbi:hypothetical protein [Paenibacillus illinoisensis]|uniref:hypothetical protein n=1 Tax=Paenibacillus illinoisensis TaxID=59845 RepID=UPI00301672E0